MAKRLFTSESVTEGHPDKVCDQISDAVLDDILAHDPNAHVACETFTTTGIVTVMGEITTKHYTDIPSIVRRTVEHRLPRPGLRLRLPLLRGDDRHRRAVPRHRHGRQRVL